MDCGGGGAECAEFCNWIGGCPEDPRGTSLAFIARWEIDRSLLERVGGPHVKEFAQNRLGNIVVGLSWVLLSLWSHGGVRAFVNEPFCASFVFRLSHSHFTTRRHAEGSCVHFLCTIFVSFTIKYLRPSAGVLFSIGDQDSWSRGVSFVLRLSLRRIVMRICRFFLTNLTSTSEKLVVTMTSIGCVAWIRSRLHRCVSGVFSLQNIWITNCNQNFEWLPRTIEYWKLYDHVLPTIDCVCLS